MKKLSDSSAVMLQELMVNPIFKGLMQELKALQPVVPSYKPGTPQEVEMLFEQIRFESGRKEGFDLLYLVLTGERNV